MADTPAVDMVTDAAPDAAPVDPRKRELEDAKESVAKRSKIASAGDRVKEIIEILTDVECKGPQALRKLLLSMVQAALASPQGKRSEAESAVIEILLELFEKEEVRRSEITLKAEPRVQAAKDAKVKAEENASNAAEAISAKVEASKAAFGKILDAAKTTCDAESKVKEVVKELLTTELDTLQDALSGCFGKLKSGSYTNDAEKEGDFTTFTAIAKKVGLDNAVLVSLPVLSKSSKDREAFDNTLIAQIESGLMGRLEQNVKLAKRMDEAAPSFGAASATMEFAEAVKVRMAQDKLAKDSMSRTAKLHESLVSLKHGPKEKPVAKKKSIKEKKGADKDKTNEDNEDGDENADAEKEEEPEEPEEAEEEEQDKSVAHLLEFLLEVGTDENSVNHIAEAVPGIFGKQLCDRSDSDKKLIQELTDIVEKRQTELKEKVGEEVFAAAMLDESITAKMMVWKKGLKDEDKGRGKGSRAVTREKDAFKAGVKSFEDLRDGKWKGGIKKAGKGAGENAEQQKLYKKLEKCCKPIKALDEMLPAVQATLKAKPEKRSDFDRKVIEKMQKDLEAHVKTYDGKIAAFESAASDKNSETFKTKVTDYDARIKEVKAAQKDFGRVASGAAAAEVAVKAQEEKAVAVKQWAVDSQQEIVNKEEAHAEARAALEKFWFAQVGLVSLRDA